MHERLYQGHSRGDQSCSILPATCIAGARIRRGEVGWLIDDRRYLERRVPLAENRQLTYMSFMLAEAWAAGYESSNVELQGWVCKMLIVIEQICLDGGRMNLAWLLSGQQDPPFHLLTQNRRRPGLQPFSRLASPSWISANLAYDTNTLL